MKFYVFVLGLQIVVAATLGFGALGLVEIAKEKLVIEAERNAMARVYISMSAKMLSEYSI